MTACRSSAFMDLYKLFKVGACRHILRARTNLSHRTSSSCLYRNGCFHRCRRRVYTRHRAADRWLLQIQRLPRRRIGAGTKLEAATSVNRIANSDVAVSLKNQNSQKRRSPSSSRGRHDGTPSHKWETCCQTTCLVFAAMIHVFAP